ncbi:MAG: flagellar hook capping protein [Lachnospiraceae bacterium]|nr:flagellar hook capping protein [Lachnospiraceae bacterium]MBO4462444.1 flagellar hook capping protein [Lachnospiraceae bacterium]MBR5789588.1 flagellar hook capping protein [Lachnospiraceae bacterium]
MAITALIENGKVIDTGANTSSKSKEQGNNSVNEDMFLQLLVAEMKYQDPLEPTSNTEWVSQYATFTQIEQSSAMQQSMKQMEAQELVGKEVIMKSTNSVTGETSYFSGVVDYMYVEGNDVFLSINDQLYNIDDLDSVVNGDYMKAVSVAKDFEAMMNKLPNVNQLTAADKTLIETVRATYDAMTSYQKEFVSQELVNQLEKLEQKIKELTAATDTEEPEDTNETETIEEIAEEEPENTEEA